MTKLLIAISLCAAFAITHAADKPATAAANEIVKGEVLETMDSGGFTYMRLKSKDGELWTAVRAAPVKVGSQVTVENAMTMKNFESKTLKRTFATIVLGDLAGAPKGPHGSATMAPAHAAAAKAPVELVAAEGEASLTLRVRPRAVCVQQQSGDKVSLEVDARLTWNGDNTALMEKTFGAGIKGLREQLVMNTAQYVPVFDDWARKRGTEIYWAAVEALLRHSR